MPRTYNSFNKQQLLYVSLHFMNFPLLITNFKKRKEKKNANINIFSGKSLKEQYFWDKYGMQESIIGIGI